MSLGEAESASVYTEWRRGEQRGEMKERGSEEMRKGEKEER